MSWSRCRFGDVVEVNPKVHLETGSEYPFLPMEDIEGGRKYNPPTQTRMFDKSGGSRFANDDSILARITPCLENGKASKVKGLHEGVGFGSTEFFVFRAVKDLTDPDFVYYLAISDIIRQPAIKSMVGASGRQRADKGVVENIIFNLPDLPTQRGIASILSAYDDLIENNNRRIALLEESMQLLYREWFVRLRFPGHEDVRVVDGLPEGWKKITIDQAFTILGGGTPSKGVQAYWQDGEINWYTPTDLTKAQAMFTEESTSKITADGLANSSARMFPSYSIMMTSRATIGAIAINTTEACTNQGFIACLPNERVPLYFLFHWLKDHVEEFISHATGATFKEITKGVFRQLPNILPDQGTLLKYEETVKPMAECVLNLQRQNKRLSEARDLLLPRLMSGEIDVS